MVNEGKFVVRICDKYVFAAAIIDREMQHGEKMKYIY